ncbi:MAG: hypothetical protein ACW986_17685 [Promethearchaeota archaeon]|jgi:hypothetical protein
MPNWRRDANTGELGCNDEERNILINGFNDFITFSCLNCFTGLREKLQSAWRNVELNCCEDVGFEGLENDGYILICIFDDPRRIEPVLLHEMVHAVEGIELDAEAIEYHCFLGNGAKAPKGDDWDMFKQESTNYDNNDKEFEGRFVIWNSDTGQVWGKTADGRKKEPPCFTSNDWKHDYDGGGWF